MSDYTNGWPDLNAVPSELLKVERLLEKKGFRVTKVMDPTSDTLEDAFEDFVDEYGFEATNRLLFFFSGHGYTRLDNTKGYLVPVDAPDPRKDEKGFVRKAFAMNNLLTLSRNIEAKHALFLFDSCFSGTIFKTKALPDEPPLITALTSKPVRQFITAGDAGETVPAKSVFTPAFIEALEYGTGDLNNDGYVTGSELGMHLQSTVRSASRQTPQYGKIDDFDLSRGDYVFLASLTTPTSLQKVIKPVRPGSSSFSLDDLTNQADEVEAARQAWEAKLVEMSDAYRQVSAIDQRNIDSGIKLNAWQRFQKAFTEDNPHSSSDNDMRSTSTKRITALKREQRNTRQLASVVSDSGGSISGTGKACDVCPEMVLIPAGSFRMGDLNGGGNSKEKPVHSVNIKAFAMGKTEVTFAEFDAFARATNRQLPKDKDGWGRGNRPVVYVSWDDAKAYVKWLSNKTGKRFRLPSESEWEYAARAGTTTKYSWGNSPSGQHANGDERYGWPSDGFNKKTAPVGSFKANAFGLNDMHGNVYEWVEDCYEASYSGAPSDGGARTSGTCAVRMLCGGGWSNEPENLRASSRAWYRTDWRSFYYLSGFRIAQDL